MHENLYNLNPSDITGIKNAALILNYRNQWPGSSNFNTYTAGFFNTFSNLKSTIGMQISHDNQGNGVINLTGISLLYGYVIKMSKTINLSAGLSGTYNIYSIDYNQLTFENNTLPITGNFTKTDFFDFSGGIELSILNSTWLGLSAGHLTTPQIMPGYNYFRKYTLSYRGSYSLYNTYTPKKFAVEPVIITTFQKDYSDVLFGSRINYSGYLGGIYLRNDINFKFDSFIILLGISLKKISIIYTYDINLSGTDSRFSKLASHEVTFFYNLEYNSRNKKKGAIKCPKF